MGILEGIGNLLWDRNDPPERTIEQERQFEESLKRLEVLKGKMGGEYAKTGRKTNGEVVKITDNMHQSLCSGIILGTDGLFYS